MSSSSVGYGISESTTDGIGRSENISRTSTETISTKIEYGTAGTLASSWNEGEQHEAHEVRALRQRVQYLHAHVEELKLTLRALVLRAQIADLKRTTRRRKRTSVSTEDATT